MNIDYKMIGARIKTVRKNKKLTQEELAEKIGVSVGYVSQVERGITKISLDLLALISTSLKTEISFFVSGSAVNSSNYLEEPLQGVFLSLDEKEKRLLVDLANAIVKNR